MIRRFIHAGAAAIAILASVSFVAADEDPQVQKQARQLYDEAKSAMVRGDYAKACPRLEAAKALLPEHINTGILLAECYQDAKKLASAAKEFTRVKELAQAKGRSDKLADIDHRLATLEPRIPTLTITVPTNVGAFSGISVTLDSVEVPRSSWGKPIPTDPGTFEVVAAATEQSSWSKKVVIDTPGDHVEVLVAPPWNVSMRQEPEKAAPGTWQRPLALGIMGVGVVGLGIGTALGVMALDKNAQSKQGSCAANDHCNQAGYDLRMEARALGNGSTIALIAGGVLAAGGMTLFVLSPRAIPKESTVSLSFSAGWNAMHMHGSW